MDWCWIGVTSCLHFNLYFDTCLTKCVYINGTERGVHGLGHVVAKDLLAAVAAVRVLRLFGGSYAKMFDAKEGVHRDFKVNDPLLALS